MKVPFLKPSIRMEDIARMNACIRSGWLTHGPYTKEFEEKLAKYAGAPYTVMTGSCTASLHMALMLAGVGPGDEVITTPLSWVASSNVILYQGAKVVFADVEADTGLLDPKEVEKKITNKTKAILLVHLYGQMCDMKAFQRIAKKHDIAIIEDTAHALEAKRDGLRPGDSGYACYSFHVAKNITSGQGGALSIRTEKDLKRAMLIRRDGVYNTPEGKRRMATLGYKYDGSDYQPALLVGQLMRVNQTHSKRAKVYERYVKGFAGTGVSHPITRPNSTHAAHMFIAWVDPAKRDLVRASLSKKGIQTSIHYDPIHLEPYYREQFGYKEGDFPNAERIGASCVSLPTYPDLTQKQQEYVIRSVAALA